MIRVQVQLTPGQAEKARNAAHERGVSVAALVREAIDAYLSEPSSREHAWQQALSVVGKYRDDGRGVAVEHDRFLEDAYADWDEADRGDA